MRVFSLAIASLLWFAAVGAAGPIVTIVTGTKPEALESLAASEMAVQLRQLFDAKIEVSDRVPDQSDQLIILGSPSTNPAVKAALGDRWPAKLSDQGQVLRSTTWINRKVLVVGGGSPVATLWAVYELGHRFGIRYTLHGDHYPAETPTFKFDAFDVVMEPN